MLYNVLDLLFLVIFQKFPLFLFYIKIWVFLEFFYILIYKNIILIYFNGNQNNNAKKQISNTQKDPISTSYQKQ